MNDLFGKKCYIDTPWIAGKKTVYRILASGMRSNKWQDVPISGAETNIIHDHFEDVAIVVLDTLVCESSRIIRVAIKDIRVI